MASGESRLPSKNALPTQEDAEITRHWMKQSHTPSQTQPGSCDKPLIPTCYIRVNNSIVRARHAYNFQNAQKLSRATDISRRQRRTNCGSVTCRVAARWVIDHVTLTVYTSGFITPQPASHMLQWIFSLNCTPVEYSGMLSPKITIINALSLKPKGCQFDNFVVTGGTLSCR